tara:strand:- start:4397 stop:5077 length:681 start_codon:yes stop_codon:yes gene_type:complete
MKKKYNPYFLLLVLSLLIWMHDLTYAQTVVYFLYFPCFFIVAEIWGQVKLTKNIIITSIVVMAFAIIAQIIGLDTVWKLPDQPWIVDNWILFPLEELGYWHAAMCLTVLIYKHMEVYFYDMVNNITIRINRFTNRHVRLKARKLRISAIFTQISLTGLVFALYMFIIENYSLIHGFFKYFNDQVTFYIWKVPAEGFLMYFCVPPFFYTVWALIYLIKNKIIKKQKM